jgi:hypothetical protein
VTYFPSPVSGRENHTSLPPQGGLTPGECVLNEWH